MFTVTKLFLTALLAISQVAAVGVKFHSLRGCKFSPIDIGCRDLKHDVCCTSKGLSAGSVTFHHAQGRTIIAYGGKNHPQCTNRVYTHRAQGKNTCINGNGSLRAHGASWKNPLTRRELEGGCKGVQEPDVAFIYGNEAVVATGNMTEVDMSKMYELANAGTAVDTWPENLKQRFLDTSEFEDVDEDLVYETVSA